MSNNNKNIAKKINDIIVNSGMTYQELESKTGIPKSALQRYATGTTSKLPLDRIEKIANALNISAVSLLGWDEAETEFTTEAVKINVYSAVHAGFPQEAEDRIVDTIEIPKSWTVGGQKYIGIEVQGDCMEPEFREGDTILVRLQNHCESGQVAVVYVNGYDAYLRKVIEKEDSFILQPTNSAYLPDTYYKNDPDNPVVIVGVVVEIRRKV